MPRNNRPAGTNPIFRETILSARGAESAVWKPFVPGDWQMVNNHIVMHARTEFEDYPEIERKRHLLRMWLAMPNSRPLSPLMHPVYRDRRGARRTAADGAGDGGVRDDGGGLSGASRTQQGPFTALFHLQIGRKRAPVLDLQATASCKK